MHSMYWIHVSSIHNVTNFKGINFNKQEYSLKKRVKKVKKESREKELRKTLYYKYV